MKYLLTVAASLATLTASPALAIDGTADALQEVIADLSIAKDRDLNFGSAPRNDGPKTIDSSSNDTDSAQFTVTGNPSTAYTVTVPAGTVTMQKGAGGTADTEIDVTGFTYYSETTSAQNSASTGVGGTDQLRIGAQRDPIGATEEVGNFSGNFTVTVVY